MTLLSQVQQTMDSLKKNIEFLKGIRAMSKEQRLVVLKKATPEQAKLIGDISANILAKILTLSPLDKINLRKHKLFIRFVGSKETSQKRRLKAVRSNSKAAAAVILTTLPKIIRLVSQPS